MSFRGLSTFKLRLVILLLLPLIPCGLYGDGFSTLKLGGSGRAAAMGMAFTSLADDGSGAFWNPAGLSMLNRGDVQLTGHRWMGELKSALIGIGAGNGRSGWGFHMLYTEIGGMEYRIEPSPAPLAEFSSHEWMGGLSYARSLGGGFSLGLSLKMYYLKIFTDEALGIGGDLGILWHWKKTGFRFGAVLQNVGKTADLRNEPVPLPLTARAGLSYAINGFGGAWIFSLDGVKQRDFPLHLHAGMEFGWESGIFFRLGFQTGYHTRDITGGVGMAWNRYRLDYTYIPLAGGLGDSHRVSIGIAW